METKKTKKKRITLLPFKNLWVYPHITVYENGIGWPIAFFLYHLNGKVLDLYTCITVNLPHCEKSAGCQFIDTNNNGDDNVDWLEENGFGKRTGRHASSGFCTYPEFDFYQGINFFEHYNRHTNYINL